MADHTHIEWTDATWNPITGCSIESPGCINCYAMKRVAPRLAKNPATPHYAGTVDPSKAGPVWTGRINLASDKVLAAPLRWKRPRMIFVNSTSDLFHENVPDEWIDRVFAVMALAPQHTFQVLTKRARRMREYVAGLPGRRAMFACHSGLDWVDWPLPNVWLGVSAERQQEADQRIPELLATPAAIRFVSAEPLLGPIDFTRINLGLKQTAGYGLKRIEWDALTGWEHQFPADSAPGCDPLRARIHGIGDCGSGAKLDQIIVGGESGQNARPMHPAWARSIRDQCAAAQVPFFFKQWGEWADVDHYASETVESYDIQGLTADGVIRVGKKRAGRLLDGVEHNGMPAIREVTAL